MKITNRLIALLCIIAVLFLAWIMYVQRVAQQQAELVLANTINSKNTGFDRIIKLEGAPFETFVYDYSCRDDLFAFMQKPDTAWADQYLASLLPSYGLSAAWIYDSSFTCVYTASRLEGDAMRELPIPRDMLPVLFGQRYFRHFFVQLADTVLEVRCAPVQPSSDWERRSKPRGFLFVGRLWNSSYLEELSVLTDSQIALRPIKAGAPIPQPSYDLSNGSMLFSRVLSSWNERPIMELAVHTEFSLLKELSRSAYMQIMQLLGFLAIVLAALITAFLCWVQLPLRRLSRSLAASDAAPLARLQKQKTEYGDFARLIINFFRQQQDLSREIAERKQAQDVLMEQNSLAILGVEVGRLLTGNDSLESILQQCAEAMQRSLDAALVRIWTLDHAEGMLKLQASAGLSTRLDGRHSRIPIGEDRIGRIALDGRPYLTNNVADDSLIHDQQWAQREGITAFAGYPLIISGQTMGVVALFSRQRMSDFTIHTLAGVVDEIALGMHRKTAEKSLLESEERYRLLVEHIDLGIALMDTDHRILMVNSKCAEMYGRPADYYAGRFCYGEFEKYGFVCPGCPGAAAMQTGAMAQVERRSVRQDGSRFDTNVMAFPVFENGAVTGFIEVTEDITERSELEEKLGEREAFFRSQFELSNTGIAITSADKGWLRVNRKLCSMLGYTEQELYRMTWAEITYPDDIAGEAAEFDKMLAGEIETYEIDKRFVRKNADIVWVHLAASCFREQDRSVRFGIASIQDITQRRQMEEQLRQSQKMEAIGTLAGGIAHDFNNILAAIMGNAELARLNVQPESPVAGNIDQILKSSDRARDLVRQILAFSRRQDQERRPVDICMLVNEAVNLLRAMVPTTINIRHSVPADAQMVHADATRIHQVIINLCTNAAQAMESTGGALEIEVASMVLNARNAARYPDTNPGRYVGIAVRDTGPGIEPRHMQRIFDPFFTTKAVGKGTGMGLAVAHGIVQDHGGSITAYSKQGKGATFYVLLPQIFEKKAETAEQLPEISRGCEKVLLVDDEEMLVDLGTSILQSLGYSVVSSYSSLEALKIFTFDPKSFDAVITDFTMPHMTGYELAEEMLRIRPGTPIILCTGFSSQVSEEQARAAGICAFVMKPYNMSEIAATLRMVLPNGQSTP